MVLVALALMSFDLTWTTRDEEALLFLEVTLGRYTLGEVEAYISDRGLWVPLGALARVLGFSIKVDTGQGTAEGWVLDKARRFSLNMEAHTLLIDGQTAVWMAETELHLTDFYLPARVFQQWFPVDLQTDLSNLKLRIFSRELLPVEARKMRQRISQLAQFGANREDGLIAEQVPYRWGAWPAITFAVAGSRHRARATAQASGDFLKMHLQAKIDWRTSEGGNVAKSAWTLTRRAGRLRFRMGNVLSGLKGGLDLGIELGTMPAQSMMFCAQTIKGTASVDWDVVLEHNGMAVDRQVVGEDGQWQFDLPMAYGYHQLRAVMYGPFGERREVRRQFLWDRSLLIPRGDEFHLAVSKGLDYKARYKRGFSKNLCLQLRGEGSITDSSLRAGVQAIMATGPVIHRLRLDRKPTLDVVGRWRRANWRLGMGEEPAVDGLTLGFPLQIPGFSHALRAGMQTDGKDWSVTGKRRMGRLSLNAKVGPNVHQLRLARRSKWADLQANLNPDHQEIFLETNAWGLRTRAQLSLADNKPALSLRMARRQKKVNLSLNLSVTPKETRWEIGVTSGLLPGPGPKWTSFDAAGPASAEVKVFFDRDGDGLFGPGDSPMPRMPILCNGRKVTATDENGTADVFLATGTTSSLTVDEAALEPGMVPKEKRVEINPRPGYRARLSFPIIEVCEVEGFVVLVQGSEKRALAAVPLEACSPDGKVLFRTRSAVDGWFLFDRLLAGSYKFRAAAEYLAGKPFQAQPVVVAANPDSVQQIEIIIKARR